MGHALHEETRNTLVLNNLHVAESEARRINGLSHGRFDYDELYAEAVYHMLRASASYDPSKGVDFPAYIRVPVANGLIDYMRRWSRCSSRAWQQIKEGNREHINTVSLHGIADDLLGTDEAVPMTEAMSRREMVNDTAMDWCERVLITMRYHAGLTYAQIGDIIGLPAFHCRQRHHLIMKRMRQNERAFAVCKQA